ncbi:MAG: hypothetical protein IJZ69_07660 [Bacteroidales bacterium]|nr:hypothetical protein [Bacteroidales bacterium]
MFVFLDFIVRKCYILKDFIERHSKEEDINVIYVDKEKKAFGNIKTKDDLDNYIENLFQPGKHNCILVDYTDSTDTIKSAHFRKDGSIRITDDQRMLTLEDAGNTKIKWRKVR